jgi:DNA polymerase III delta subunit
MLDLESLKSDNKEKEVSIINGDSITDVGEIFINNESYGLFNNKNLTIVKRFFRNSKKISLEKKVIEKLEKCDISNQNLIFWEDKNIFTVSRVKAKPKTIAKKPRATSKLNTYLKNHAEIKQNDEISVGQIHQWIKKEFEKEKVVISDRIINDFIVRVGTNQSLLASELNKLVLWARADQDKNINNKVLDEVTILYEKDYQTWDLTDAFFSKNKVQALKVLKRLLKNPQQDFPMVISSVLKQLKIIYVIKKYNNDPRLVMSKLHLLPFIFTKAQRMAQNFSLKDLKVMYQKFINLDYSIKLGKIDVKLGLNLLIMTLS